MLTQLMMLTERIMLTELDNGPKPSPVKHGESESGVEAEQLKQFHR